MRLHKLLGHNWTNSAFVVAGVHEKVEFLLEQNTALMSFYVLYRVNISFKF